MIFDKYLYSKDKILEALYEENQSFILEALQNDKIDKNLKFDWDEPLLNQVLKHGYGLVFKKMIEKNVDVNQADSEGVTPVMVVSEHNKHHFLDKDSLNQLDKRNEFFFTLLKQAGSDANILNKEGHSALMIAIQKGYIQLVRDMIKGDANVLLKNEEGKDAYHFAMKSGDMAIVKEIKEAAKKEMNSYFMNSQAYKRLLIMKNERVYGA